MAMVLVAFVSNFLKMLDSYGKEKIARILGVSEEIKELHRKLALIHNVLADAERRQLRNDTAVGQWLDDLRDIMYDAEDIIEEYKIEAERYTEEESESSLSVRFRSHLKLFGQAKSKNDFAKKIKDLNERLDDINKEKEAFRLVQIPTKETKQIRIMQTTSHIDGLDIVGSVIKDDIRHMVGLLTQENNKNNILIYAIVGMGGIGKTTLAQKICNDDILLTSFHPLKPIWVCISKDNVDEIRILKSIICSLGGDSSNVNERGQLEQILNEVVRGKRLFLVLDDVWDAQVWKNLLRKPLSSAGLGSRVLLTTRDAQIAMQLGAEHRHDVAKLSDEDGWSLLCKKVFKHGEEEEMHALKEIGMKIVDKCDGLPVAINAIAGILRTKRTTKFEWERVLLDPFWSSARVEQVFKVSYEDLRYHLKQCFLYFALFPKDSYLRRDEITRMWIAEGFVKAKDNKMLEETANDYWKELIQRNLLQVMDLTTLDCTMHNLLLMFAQDLVQGECFCGDAQSLNEIVRKTRKKTRRWYSDGVNEFSFDAIDEPTFLRTFIRYGDPRDNGSNKKQILDNSLQLLQRVRILILRYSNLKRLPTDLRYFRYLDLSYSNITELPESIKSLRNLQFLCLNSCENLQSLPIAIGFLTNLRYIDIRHTKIDRMPKEMAKLGQLRTFLGFKIAGIRDGDTWCTLEDVKHFMELKELSLYNLERTSAAEASAVALADKAHLTRLELDCFIPEEKCDEATMRRIIMAYEILWPPNCIEELYIDGYYGSTFPSWLTRVSSMKNLRILKLGFCPDCEVLPPLCQLPELTELTLFRLGLRQVGIESFLPNPGDAFQRSFPKLKMLCFEDLNNWEEWKEGNEHHQNYYLQKKIVFFPCLKTIKIYRCPKLRYLPHLLLNRATVLRELHIHEADELNAVENLHHIETLKINRCLKLKRVANLTSLKTLHINACENLIDVERLPKVRFLTWYIH